MVVVTSGKNWKGEPCEFYLDGFLQKNLDEVKAVVTQKDFDYVALVCGYPGLGKSNFAINCCKFLDKDFTIDNIAWNDDEFIEKTNNAKPGTAIMLDESFASLNSRISMSASFLKIVNHIQLIRQKNLFIFLCLPNFFDLSKGIAIYRSSHLFLCYGKEFGDRGSFCVWDREKKKDLFILGQKFMNYNAQKSNFKGRFVKQKAIDETLYRKLKADHLTSVEVENREVTTKAILERNKLIAYNNLVLGMTPKEIENICGLKERSIYGAINSQRAFILEKQQKNLW